MITHLSRGWSCTNHMAEHELITWLSMQWSRVWMVLIMWLIKNWSRGYNALITWLRMHWSCGWSYTDDVTDQALITWLIIHWSRGYHALITWLHMHCSRNCRQWSRGYHALITCLSCTELVADHTLITCLPMHESRDCTCTEHVIIGNDQVATMHWSSVWSCNAHVSQATLMT